MAQQAAGAWKSLWPVFPLAMQPYEALVGPAGGWAKDEEMRVSGMCWETGVDEQMGPLQCKHPEYLPGICPYEVPYVFDFGDYHVGQVAHCTILEGTIKSVSREGSLTGPCSGGSEQCG